MELRDMIHFRVHFLQNIPVFRNFRFGNKYTITLNNLLIFLFLFLLKVYLILLDISKFSSITKNVCIAYFNINMFQKLETNNED